jgi:hypothetical protein
MIEAVDVDAEQAASIDHGACDLVLHPPAIPGIGSDQYMLLGLICPSIGGRALRLAPEG